VQRAEKPPPSPHRLPLPRRTRRCVESDDALRLAPSARCARDGARGPGACSGRPRLRAPDRPLPLRRP
jgi:hypothetical protein